MSFYYPKDSMGHRLAFRTLDKFVYDDNGVDLSTKLAMLEEAFANVNIPTEVANRIYYDHAEGKLYLYAGDKLISQTVLRAESGGTTHHPADVYNVNFRVKDSELVVRWADPNDTVFEGSTLATWKGTKVVYKEGEYPSDPDDGVLVIDNTERNRYAEDGLSITGLTNNTTYYFRFFPYSPSGDVNMNDRNYYTATPSNTIIYGFKIQTNNSDPNVSVTYIEGAAGKRAAGMNYMDNTFSWGDWDKDEFFMPRPCMLRYDGIVDYYLDPDDYTKRIDGTPSEITDPYYQGNAMMEWGRNGDKIWYKVVEGTSNDVSVYISNQKVDNNYVAWSFIDCNNEPKDHFYTPIYNGYLIDGRLRSLSNKTPLTYKTVNDEITYAVANNNIGSNVGAHWYTELFADRLLINLLLILMGRSLDTQTVYGHGYTRDKSPLVSGTMNKKGLFYGEATGETGVKVFGMENWWGNVRRRIAGLICSSGTYKYKLTYGRMDGTGNDGFSVNGTGYLTGPQFSATGYISNITPYSNGSYFPSSINGSSSTYFCDYAKYSTGTNYVACGGPCEDEGLYDYDFQSGAFAYSLNLQANKVDYITGSALSYR